MKRVPELILLCCIIPCLLASGTAGVTSHPSAANNLHAKGIQDSKNLMDFLTVDSFNLDIIPPSSGVQFFKNGILFLSNTKFEGKMLPKHVSFGSIEAYTAIVKDTSLGLHLLFSPSLSFSFPCEATTFSSDYKTMYFTKISKKATKEKIFRAIYKTNAKGESGWFSDENPLDFCTGNYIYTHPALSADGNMLIFASDMEGSSGGLDLFIVRKNGEKWSKPENMGKSINTNQFECFPYLDQDNNLYFSSDGLQGFGGYDIFTCRYNGENWDKPVNLSRRINSAYDDISFCIDKIDGKTAFYTQRPVSGKGEMQLFRVSVKKIVVDNNPLSISYIYNGKPGTRTNLTALNPPKEVPAPAPDTIKTLPAEVKKEPPVEEKKTIAVPVKKSTGAKEVTIKNTSALPDALKDVVVYRVQFLTTTNARKENQIIMNGVEYKTFEYFYLGAYRYTIGEFTSLAPARELQSLCRKSGYPQAFVAAFKNESRSLDLTLFK